MASKRKGGENRFYVLSRELNSAARATSNDAQYGNSAACDLCGKAIGVRFWLPPYRADLEIFRSEYPDISFGSCEWLLASKRFCDVWHKSRLIGLTGFDRVEIVELRAPKRPRGTAPQYSKADVARSNAAIDQELSGYEWSVESPICDKCRFPSKSLIKRWKRLVLEPETWSGEDVFIARGSAQIMVTERFVKVCNANRLKNAAFIAADEYAYDFYPWERSDWEAQILDETAAVLRERNRDRRFDKVLRAMNAIRDEVITERRNHWIKDIDERCPGFGSAVAEAASTAYYRLVHRP